jgi:CheY-like chemotaxis protein
MAEKKTILLAEDEKDVAEMYQIAFEKAGFRVVIAADGEEALKIARDDRPDVFLLDINMPKKDGFEVLSDLRSDYVLSKALKNVPIIMLTNYNNPQDIEYCNKFGVEDYIVKSEWKPAYIVNKIKAYLKEEAAE